METIKRKILLEESIDRRENSPTWGAITADTFYINVFITQNIDDMGLFTDIEYFSADTLNPTLVDYTILTNKLNSLGLFFPFMAGVYPTYFNNLTGTTKIITRNPYDNVSDYYNFGNLHLSAFTDTKIEDVKSYDNFEPYKIGFNMDSIQYLNYRNEIINGVDRVISLNEENIYVFDAENDFNIGTNNQITGLRYQDSNIKFRNVFINGLKYRIPVTIVNFITEGWNETNTSLSAITKEEYLFGIISKPEVKSDVFIDRGVTSVIEKHLRLSEVNNLSKLSRYGNGFYNINKI